VRVHAGDAHEVRRGRRLARWRLRGGAGVRWRRSRHGGKAGIGFEEETAGGLAPGESYLRFFFSVVVLWTKTGVGSFATRERTLTR
jgi:hypothetical protein